jgi:hypothetical protein
LNEFLYQNGVMQACSRVPGGAEDQYFLGMHRYALNTHVTTTNTANTNTHTNTNAAATNNSSGSSSSRHSSHTNPRRKHVVYFPLALHTHSDSNSLSAQVPMNAVML